jgi:archaemetzincin
MCGSNSLKESDRRPLYLCPECNAKICWATGSDPIVRYMRLMKFSKENGFQDEYEFFERSFKALASPELTHRN